MGQQVHRHESAVTVAADADAIRIRYSHLSRFINRRFCAHHDLFDVGVVDCLRRTDHGHRCVVEHGIAFEQEEEMRWANYRSRSLRGTGNLSGGARIIKLDRVGPNDSRQSGALFVIRRQVERE